MAENMMRIGITIVNLERVITIHLAQEWAYMPMDWIDCPDDNEGRKAPEGEPFRGIEIIMDLRQGDVQAADFFPSIFRRMNYPGTPGDFLLRICLPADSEEAAEVRNFADEHFPAM